LDILLKRAVLILDGIIKLNKNLNKMKKELLIPFSGKTMLGKFYTWIKNKTFKSGIPFYDTLEYTDYDMGSRTLTVYLKSLNGTTYRMFYSEFNKILPQLIEGKLSGNWGFRNHAGHFTLTYLGK